MQYTIESASPTNQEDLKVQVLLFAGKLPSCSVVERKLLVVRPVTILGFDIQRKEGSIFQVNFANCHHVNSSALGYAAMLFMAIICRFSLHKTAIWYFVPGMHFVKLIWVYS